MKRSVLLILVFALFLAVASPQNVPNRGFEQWETRELYEKPANWYTSNFLQFLSGIADFSAVRTNESVTGNYSLKLKTIVYENDTLGAYATSEGEVSGAGFYNLSFIGGFPINSKPDSLWGYYKYDIPQGDTAYILAAFKKNGVFIGMNYIRLTGNSNGFIRMAEKLDTLLDTPDTAFIAFSTTQIDKPLAGGVLYIDEVGFYPAATIPNSDFEVWETPTYSDPVGWNTTNSFDVATGSEISAFQTTDPHSGEYALKLVTTHLNFINENMSLANNGQLSMSSFSGGFPFKEMPESLSGYYKYMPVGNDTALIALFFSKYDPGTQTSSIVGIETFDLLPQPSYKYFEHGLNPGNLEFDTMNIVATASKGSPFGAYHNQPGSMLFLDDLWLKSACSAADTTKLFTYTDTVVCNGDTMYIDPGAGYASYLWSDNTTDQILKTTLPGTYSVTVTDTAGCDISDSVSVVFDPCTRIVIPPEQPSKAIKLYPNPFTGQLTIEFNRLAAQTLEVGITNILGQTVYRKTINNPNAELKMVIDLGQNKQGLYFVRVKKDGRDKLFKVIKK